MASYSVSFDSFLRLAKMFYISIGIEPFDGAYAWRHSYLLDIFFIVCIVSMNFLLFGQIIYVIAALFYGNDFFEATITIAYIGFTSVSEIKIWSVLKQKSKLTKLIKDLRDIFPHKLQLQPNEFERIMKRLHNTDVDKQHEYGVYEFFMHYMKIGGLFGFLHLICIWTYNLFSIASYLLYGGQERQLPYSSWIPWDWHDNWSYHLIYTIQNIGGHACMMAQVANDLLLCVVITQIIMHYRYLARRISAFGANSADEKNDGNLEFLKAVVQYHQRVFSLSDEMNEVFGVTLLMNFISSALIICLLGFLMTIGINSTLLAKLFLFLFCSLLQIYMLTNFGQQLIIASESIGHAVYNHDWLKADVRYRKMLVLIINRAHKPTILKATTFLNVSLTTMTDLLQLSYKFYALLRTIYAK